MSDNHSDIGQQVALPFEQEPDPVDQEFLQFCADAAVSQVNIEKTPNEKKLLSPGQQLRAAREAQSLTLDTASQQTHISIYNLKLLEADASLALSDTFVKGYIRNYAVYLGLNAESLLESAGFSCQPEPAIASETEATATEVKIEAEAQKAGRIDALQDRLVSGVQKLLAARSSAGISLGFRNGSSWSKGLMGSPAGLLRAATTTTLPLLCLCIVAFAYHAFDGENANGDSVSVASLSADQAPEQLGVLAHEAVAVQAQQTPEPVVLAALDNAAASDATEDGYGAGDSVPSTQSPQLAFGTTPGVSSPSAQEEALQLDERVQVLAELNNTVKRVRLNAVASEDRDSQSVVPNANIQGLHEPVGPGAVDMIAQMQMQDRLVIMVYEDSWVDVRDKYGGRLYRDLARAGRKIDVSGRLPFSLHVGNAPGLELELNGEPVEITRYRSDNSARLTLASN